MSDENKEGFSGVHNVFPGDANNTMPHRFKGLVEFFKRIL